MQGYYSSTIRARDKVTLLCFWKDETLVGLVGVPKEASIIVWNIKGIQIKTFKARLLLPVKTMCIIENSLWQMSGSQIGIWDLNNCKRTTIIECSSSKTDKDEYHVEMTRLNEYIVTLRGSTVTIWNTNTYLPINVFKVDYYMTNLQEWKNDLVFAISSKHQGSRVLVWDINGKTKLELIGHAERIDCLEVLKDLLFSVDRSCIRKWNPIGECLEIIPIETAVCNKLRTVCNDLWGTSWDQKMHFWNPKKKKYSTKSRQIFTLFTKWWHRKHCWQLRQVLV